MRRDTFPLKFIERLGKRLKGFSKLQEKHQMALAIVIWNLSRYRKHNRLDGWYSISHQELERRFGRKGFALCNDAVKALEQSEHQGLGSTKAYRLTSRAAKIREAFLEGEAQTGKPWTLAYDDGRAVRRIWKNAIAPKAADGATVKAWKGFSLPSTIEVNVEALKRSEKALQKLVARSPANPQTDLWQDKAIDLEERLHATRQILMLADTTACPGGVPHRYVESHAGRLYAVGVNLQTVPRLVRAVALDRLWDYDIDNCHYTLLAQMAHRQGLLCPAIDGYVADKDRIRRGIAKRVGIDSNKVKRCLIALIYGAKRSTSEKAAIAQEVGPIKVIPLLLDQEFLAISNEVRTMGQAILGSWPRSNSRAGKRLINAAGKGIAHDADPKEMLSHLLQGAEAEILREVIRTHGGDIVLPLHDGWVSKRQLDPKALEAHIEKALGWRVSIEEKRLQPPGNLIG